MEEQLKKIIEHLDGEGGELVVQRLDNSTNRETPWMVSYEFGQEAKESDMVGGAAYGIGKTAEDAVRSVFEQCGLDKETVELPDASK